MKSEKELELFYKEIAQDFKNKLDLKIEEVMVLEAISFKLLDIEKENTTNYSIYNSKYAFNHLDNTVVNMFMDETNSNRVNPIIYYGEKTIKQSNIYKLLKKNKANDRPYTRANIECLANHIVNEIKVDTYKEDHSYEDIVSDYYCTSIDTYDSFTFAKKKLSKKAKEELINYMINNLEIENKSEYESFFINRTTDEYDKLRVLIIDYLDYTSLFSASFNDFNSISIDNKTRLIDSLLLLFASLYIEKYGDTEELVEDIFKREVIKDDFKNLFFNSLELLLNKNNNCYDEILGMI